MCSLARVDACYEYHVWLFCVCFFFSLSLSLYERDPTFFLLFFFPAFARFLRFVPVSLCFPSSGRFLTLLSLRAFFLVVVSLIFSSSSQQPRNDV